MKKQQNNSTRAWALQIALLVALLSISAVLLASSFKATPVASGLSVPIEAVAAGDNDLVIAGLASARSLSPADAPFTFSNTGSLNTVRYGHTATLLPSDHFSRTSSRRCRMVRRRPWSPLAILLAFPAEDKRFHQPAKTPARENGC